MKKHLVTATTLALALSVGVAHAQDSSALVDALVRKKLLTAQEGEEVRADLIRENAAANAGKLQLSNSITSLKLYGDVRLRYQYDNKDPQIETPLSGSSYLFSSNDSSYITNAFYSKNDKTTKFTSSSWSPDAQGYAIAGSNVYNANGKLILPKGARLVDANGHYIRGSVNPALTGVGSPQHGTQRSLERIRLRLNGDFTLAGGFFGGVQLQTSQAADGGNQTIGDSTSGASGFGNYNIYISRAYFGWGNDWLTLVGGKQPNPFYTTDLVWDPDINPDGFVEKIDIIKLFNYGVGEAVGYTKSGKSVSSVSNVSSASPYELSLVAGQLIYSDNFEDAFGSDFKTDSWLFDVQLVGSAKVTKSVKVTLAPGFMTYTSGNTANLGDSVPFSGGVNTYQYSADSKNAPLIAHSANRDLAIITAPGDVSFKLLGLKTKVLWDFAYNTQGAARVADIFGLQDIQIPVKNAQGVVTGYKNTHGAITNSTLVSATRVSGHSSEDDVAWLAGIQVGENKKAGNWSVLANFRQTGIAAIDPNLNDSDFALSYLNTQGVKTGLAYNFTDFAVGAITYYDAWNLRKDLVGGEATGGQKLANVNAVQVFQVDLSIKF